MTDRFVLVDRSSAAADFARAWQRACDAVTCRPLDEKNEAATIVKILKSVVARHRVPE